MSFKDIVIYGMGPPDERATRIIYQKSVRRETIDKFLTKASKAEKAEFLRYFYILREMLFTYFAVSERPLLYFDNSAIQAVLHSDKKSRQPQFNSLLALLCLAEDYCLVDLAAYVSPTVAFEANHRKRIASEADAASVLQRIGAAMEGIGLDTVSVDFDTATELADATQRLEQDQNSILAAIKAVRDMKWKLIKAEHQRGVPLPLAIAEERVPDVELTYFRPWYVKFILMAFIIRELYEANGHWPEFRNICKQDLARSVVGNVLSTSGGKLSGLGDIELYSYCELNSQSASRVPYVCMAVAFDETLNKALRGRMQIHGRSFGFRGGLDNSSIFATAMVYSQIRSAKVDEKLNRRAGEYHEALRSFSKDILIKHYPEVRPPDSEGASTA